MKGGKEPQRMEPHRMGWREEKNHTEWDVSRKRTNENEIKTGREPQRRMRWNSQRTTENEM